MLWLEGSDVKVGQKTLRSVTCEISECSESERQMQELHYDMLCCTRPGRSSDDDAEIRNVDLLKSDVTKRGVVGRKK